MKLNTRFALLLGFLLAALVTSVALLTGAHQRQTRRSVELLQREQAMQLDHILTLTTNPLQHFARDYSMWDELMSFVQTRDPVWAKINLEASLDTFRLVGIWVVNANGEQVYRISRDPLKEAAWPVELEPLFTRLQQTPFLHFYAKVGDSLLEFQTAPIQPSSDVNRTTTPNGWLVAVRHWDENALQSLAEITRAQVFIEPTASGVAETAPGTIEIVRQLGGVTGRPIAQLKLQYVPEQLAHLKRYGNVVLTVVIVQGIVSIVLLVLGLRAWIVQPFRRISESLVAHNSGPVEQLSRSPSELGHIARLVKEHFAAEVALKKSELALSRALEERVRLGRELHDGVIQSIYAAGMGLAATRDMIKAEPSAAVRKTDEIRATLNETIREVRSHIMRLELAELQPKSFRQCVQEVVTATSHNGILVETEVDEAAAEALSVNQRTDALQRMRDWLVSHGKTRARQKLLIRVHRDGARTRLALINDGTAAEARLPASAEAALPDGQDVRHEQLADGRHCTTVTYSIS